MSTNQKLSAARSGLVAVALLVLAGCASGPSPASTAMSGDPAHSATSMTANGTSMTTVQKLVAQAREAGLNGVYALTRGGETLYCWRQHIVGSNIPRTDCVSHAGQLRSILRAMAHQRHMIQEAPQGGCGGQGVCTGN